MNKFLFAALVSFSLNAMAHDCLPSNFQVLKDNSIANASLCADRITQSGGQVSFDYPYFSVKGLVLSKKIKIAASAGNKFCSLLGLKDGNFDVLYHILPGKDLVDFETNGNFLYVRGEKTRNEMHVNTIYCNR